ncbi:hypothetical protein JW859_02560 [bacterium]|nr:hypothetical protein [bacterium]
MLDRAMLIKWVVNATGLILLMLAAACGPRQLEPSASGTGAIPSLPPDGYIAANHTQRSAAEEILALAGDDSDTYSAGATVDSAEHTLSLAPGTGIAWALYTFTGLSYDVLPSAIGITLSGNAPVQYWAAVADYAADAWHWAEIAPEGNDSFYITGLGRAVSTTGALHVLVLARAPHQASIAELRLYLNLPPQPPKRLTVDQGNQAGEYVLSWLKAEQATGYRIYRDDAAEVFATAGDAGIWVDTTAGGQGRVYWLRAVNEYGSSPLSPPAYGLPGAWNLQRIAATGQNSIAALAELDGNPLIAYTAIVENAEQNPVSRPRFARATTESPRGPDDWVVIRWSDWEDAIYHDPSLAVLAGKPVFTVANCYYQALTAAPGGPADWAMHVFDSAADINGPVPPLEYLGAPCLVYIDSDRDALRFSLAATAQPAAESDWVTSTIDEFAIVSSREYWPALINGRPAVAYERRDGMEESGDLYYGYPAAPAPAGPDDWLTHLVDDIPNYPAGVSEINLISLADGKPAICYVECYPDYNGLKFARATTTFPKSPADWEIHTILADLPSPGSDATMCLMDGKPAICYDGENGFTLATARLAAPSDPDDWVFETIYDFTGGWNLCLREIGGRPQLVFNTHDGLFLLSRRA